MTFLRKGGSFVRKDGAFVRTDSGGDLQCDCCGGDPDCCACLNPGCALNNAAYVSGSDCEDYVHEVRIQGSVYGEEATGGIGTRTYSATWDFTVEVSECGNFPETDFDADGSIVVTGTLFSNCSAAVHTIRARMSITSTSWSLIYVLLAGSGSCASKSTLFHVGYNTAIAPHSGFTCDGFTGSYDRCGDGTYQCDDNDEPGRYFEQSLTLTPGVAPCSGGSFAMLDRFRGTRELRGGLA